MNDFCHWQKTAHFRLLDELVVLQIVSSCCVLLLQSDEQDPPWSLVQLHKIAEEEHGWVLVVNTLLTVVPLDDPLGPAAIALLLDDCSLPTKVLQVF